MYTFVRSLLVTLPLCLWSHVNPAGCLKLDCLGGSILGVVFGNQNWGQPAVPAQCGDKLLAPDLGSDSGPKTGATYVSRCYACVCVFLRACSIGSQPQSQQYLDNLKVFVCDCNCFPVASCTDAFRDGFAPPCFLITGTQDGCPIWLPEMAARDRFPRCLPEMSAKDGCPRWLPEMAARDGCPRWLPEMAARDGCPR